MPPSPALCRAPPLLGQSCCSFTLTMAPHRRPLCSAGGGGQPPGLWRLPRKHLVQLPGGRHLCSRRGSIVDPKAGTETPLSECGATAALVRRHACRLLAASVGVSLALTCGFAEYLNEVQHRETLNGELASLRSRLQGYRETELASSEGRAANARARLEAETELRETRADLAQLDMCRDSGMNRLFGLGYLTAGLALLCRPGCAMRMGSIAPFFIAACGGAGLASILSDRRNKAGERAAFDLWLLVPPPPFTHFVQRASVTRDWW